MDKQISVEEAIKYLCMIPIPFISGNRDCDTEELQKYSIALSMAIKALETLEEFEKAQIITGGRLNGRTYAYKCGLEDGKRKALEQEPTAKIGHWVYKIYGGFHEQGNWYCSHCDYRYNYGNGHAKFCPECGYEMSEPSTEEVIRDRNYEWIIRR